MYRHHRCQAHQSRQLFDQLWFLQRLQIVCQHENSQLSRNETGLVVVVAQTFPELGHLKGLMTGHGFLSGNDVVNAPEGKFAAIPAGN